jgi:hypothetical protein
MNCEGARDSILLAAYGELADEQAISLEQHLAVCPSCQAELGELRQMDEMLALHPVAEVNPNLLAQSRMRLDEALDQIPSHGFMARLGMNAAIWFGHIQSAPALATLLIGSGFLAGNLTYRYQVANAPKIPPTVILSNQNGGGVATVSGINRLPGDMVQVSYNRIVPEMAEGSLDDPQIRQLLMVASKDESAGAVRVDSVALLATECLNGHHCVTDHDGTGIRSALIASLRTDKSANVRMKALEGLQPYVSQDEHVRDAVAQALLTDSSATVRSRAIAVLDPVKSDTSVRQVLRAVSTTDVNPYLRTVSTRELAGSSMQ